MTAGYPAAYRKMLAIRLFYEYRKKSFVLENADLLLNRNACGCSL